jgi:hypothetical protein
MPSVAELPSLGQSSPASDFEIPLSVPLDAGEQFRRALPEVRDVLKGLRGLVETKIYSRLLGAKDEEQQRLAVVAIYRPFRDYYCAMAFAAAANLGHDRERLAQLLLGSFEEARALLRERGPRTIAADAVAIALHGLHTIGRVATALRDLKVCGRDPSPEIIREVIDNWIAYMMCFGALAYALDTGAGKASPEMAERLAFWSRGYAVAAYAALDPLLPAVPRPEGDVPRPEVLSAEDEALLLTAEHDLVRRLDRDNARAADC